VFSSEYQDGTDAVILATRHGRGRLVTAKVIASLLFSTVYFALCAAILCGVALGAFGAEGGDLPIQLITVTVPCDLTMAQAVAIGIALAYLMTMGFAALTLALSSRTKSTLSVFMVDVVLVLMTALIPTGGISLLEHISYLFPAMRLPRSTLCAKHLVCFGVGGTRSRGSRNNTLLLRSSDLHTPFQPSRLEDIRWHKDHSARSFRRREVA
jgi:ABC-type transport system involved in multi-copper enzyme maturation permease subunit